MANRWGIARQDDGQWRAMAGDRQLALVGDRDSAIRALSSAYAAAPDVPDLAPGQRQFSIPLLIAEGIDTSDLRYFTPGTGTTRDLPLFLMLLTQTSWGHDGAVVCGRIDSLQRVTPVDSGSPGGLGNARGVYLDTDEGRMAAMLADQQVCNGISADLSELDATFEEVGEPDEFGMVDVRMVATSYQVGGATQCTMPAFAMCRIQADPEEGDTASSISNDRLAAAREYANHAAPSLRLALTHGDVERRQTSRAPIRAAAIDDIPLAPADWFRNPHLEAPTPLTVRPDGRVFGHLALWGKQHRGVDGPLVPPRNVDPNYGQFRLGSVNLDDGTECPTGNLTVDCGHAPLRASARAAAAHYDDTGSQAAQVAAGNDEHGVWVAGWVSPYAKPEQIYALRASALSGDWRWVGGRRELVAALGVPVAGFDVPRAQSHEENGRQLALVASGARELFALKQPVERAEYDKVVARLELLESALLPTIASGMLEAYDEQRAS